MIYYTSDQHFGHSNIIKSCKRPFSEVSEMDNILINYWNDVVTSEDEVFILGDFIFRSDKSPNFYLDRLKGKKHVILGNHDHKWIKNCDLSKNFASVNYYLEIKDGEKSIVLCHFPILQWAGSKKGSLHIHGHIHNNRNGLTFETLKKMDNALNCGVDINDFKPVGIFTLKKNNTIFKNRVINAPKNPNERIIWDECKIIIQNEVSDITYKTWIESLKLKHIGENSIIFYSLNSFTKSFSEQYIPLMKNALFTVTGEEFEVKIEGVKRWPH